MGTTNTEPLEPVNGGMACYDLAQRPCSFDVTQFMVTATTLGYDHIRIGFEGKYHHKDFKDYDERKDSIILPSPALLGVEWSVGAPEGEQNISHAMGGPLMAYKRMGFVQKYKSVLEPKTGDYITVTLRNSRREHKNSNIKAWQEFMSRVTRHKIVLIDDYTKKKIHLHERMALYAGAAMNFMTAQGPSSLLYFSDYPYCAFRMGAGPLWFLEQEGLKKGFQWPFAKDNQRIFWGEDESDDEIWQAYEQHCGKHVLRFN